MQAYRQQCPPRQQSAASSGSNHIPAVGLNQTNSTTGAVNVNKIAHINNHEISNTHSHFNKKQLDILKNSICKGVSNEEFEVFLMACVKTQLDPFMRQIYAVKRKAKKPDGSWGETMTIQTGIDGYRLIAERTERYAPGPEPTYAYDNNGGLQSATAFIKKQTRDGTWHTVSASAYIDEYCQTFTDRSTGEKKATGMWGNMPRTMLAKCAEAQALRKAFPAEMSGVYTKEEMQQADPIDVTPKMTLEQAADLEMILDECDPKYKTWVYEYIVKTYNSPNLCDVPAEMYERMKVAASKNMNEQHAKQKAAYDQHDEVLQVEAQ